MDARSLFGNMNEYARYILDLFCCGIIPCPGMYLGMYLSKPKPKPKKKENKEEGDKQMSRLRQREGS